MRRPIQIPHTLLVDAAGQEDLVNKAQCDDAAGIDKRQVSRLIKQGRWRRVTRGVYDTDPLPVQKRKRDRFHEHVRRRIAWIALLAYDDAIATGACALALYGVAGLPREFVSEVALPGGADVRGRGDITVRQYKPFPVQLRRRAVAQIEHALAQAVPNLTRDHAVAVLSSAMHEKYIDHAGLQRIHDLIRGRRGAELCHAWFDLVSERDESAAETFARLSCMDHGVPPDGQQVLVMRGEEFLARADMVYRLPDGRWVVVEIDGIEFHGRPGALARDSRRQNGLVGASQVIVLRYAASENDLPGGVGRQVAAQLDRLGWVPGYPLAEGEEIDLSAAVRRRASA